MLNTTRPFFKILAVAYCSLTCTGLAQSAPSASWNQASSPGFASGCLPASSFNHFLDITRIDSHRNCREASEMFPFRELSCRVEFFTTPRLVVLALHRETPSLWRCWHRARSEEHTSELQSRQ